MLHVPRIMLHISRIMPFSQKTMPLKSIVTSGKVGYSKSVVASDGHCDQQFICFFTLNTS